MPDNTKFLTFRLFCQSSAREQLWPWKRRETRTSTYRPIRLLSPKDVRESRNIYDNILVKYIHTFRCMEEKTLIIKYILKYTQKFSNQIKTPWSIISENYESANADIENSSIHDFMIDFLMWNAFVRLKCWHCNLPTLVVKLRLTRTRTIVAETLYGDSAISHSSLNFVHFHKIWFK